MGPQVQGKVVYLYAFDVANEIKTSRVSGVLSNQPVPFQIRRDRSIPKDVPLYKPLHVEIKGEKAKLRGSDVSVMVRIYDVGVVTVDIQVAVACDSLAALISYHNPVSDHGKSFDELALEVCQQVCTAIDGARIGGVPPTEAEAYTVFCLTDLPGVELPAWVVANRREIAGLLTETSAERLSDEQVGEVMRIQRSFETTDLVVIDWDAALVVDLSGYVEDVLYVLELANLQLEEFRVMDQRLDAYLEGAYVDMERRRLPLFRLRDSKLAGLRSFRVDVAKLADEVGSIGKLFGDWYLARVYLGAKERFYLNEWRHSVEDRVAQLDHLYSVAHSEVSERRMLWLEVIIVVLFALDLFGLFFLRR